MKRFALSLIVALVLVPTLAATPAKPIDPLLWLVGGTWTAQTPGFGSITHIDTAYRLASNDAFVRFTTAFAGAKSAVPTYDGNFYYDPATTQFAMWYVDNKGAIVQGPVAIDGDITSILFESGDPRDGKPGQMRVVLTRHTNDYYTWSLYNLTRDPVKPIFSLDYHRH